jgi:tetratricopeptide (TPR) repeat protein
MTTHARSRFARIALGASCLLAVAETPTFAQTAPRTEQSPESEARSAMQTGITLFGRGDAEGALREYERAKRLVPKANLPYRYAAEALVALGRHREAVDNFRGYLEKNPTVSDAETVRRRIAELEERLSRGVLSLRATVVGALARVDDHEPTLLPHDFSLSVGEHKVVVEHEGYLRLEQRIEVVAGKREELLVSLVAEPKTTRHPEPPLETPKPTRTTTVWPTVGAVGIAVGATTFVVGAIVDATALGAKFDAVDAAARVGDSRLESLQDETRGMRTGVQVTYVVGLVTLVAGAAVLLFAPHHVDTTSRSAARGPLTFRF